MKSGLGRKRKEDSYDNPMDYLNEIIFPEQDNLEKFKEQEIKIVANDAVLIINYEKNGQRNYIGGATFLEIFKAFELEKLIYLMNPIPEGIFTDELKGMSPIVIYRDLSKIKNK